MIEFLEQSHTLTDSEIEEYNNYLIKKHNSHNYFSGISSRFKYLQDKHEQGGRELFEKEFKKTIRRRNNMIRLVIRSDYTSEEEYQKAYKEILEYIKIHDSLYGFSSNLSYEECIKQFEEEMLKYRHIIKYEKSRSNIGQISADS